MTVGLRPVTLDDCDLLAGWKDQELLRKMSTGLDTIITGENQREDIERSLQSVDEDYKLIWTDQAIGYIRINWIDDDHKFAWLRFGLGRQRGRGYGYEALRLYLNRLFEGETVRVEAEVYAFNKPSLALLTKLGFKVEGCKRKAHFEQGQYADVYVLGLLKEEYK